MKKILNLPDGSKYVGELKNNKRHGQGTITYLDGNELHSHSLVQ